MLHTLRTDNENRQNVDFIELHSKMFLSVRAPVCHTQLDQRQFCLCVVFTHVMSKLCLVRFTTMFLHKAPRAVILCRVLCFTGVFSSASCVLLTFRWTARLAAVSRGRKMANWQLLMTSRENNQFKLLWFHCIHGYTQTALHTWSKHTEGLNNASFSGLIN